MWFFEFLNNEIYLFGYLLFFNNFDICFRRIRELIKHFLKLGSLDKLLILTLLYLLKKLIILNGHLRFLRNLFFWGAFFVKIIKFLIRVSEDLFFMFVEGCGEDITAFLFNLEVAGPKCMFLQCYFFLWLGHRRHIQIIILWFPIHANRYPVNADKVIHSARKLGLHHSNGQVYYNMRTSYNYYYVEEEADVD